MYLLNEWIIFFKAFVHKLCLPGFFQQLVGNEKTWKGNTTGQEPNEIFTLS